jgi:DNA replication protein DnaC
MPTGDPYADLPSGQGDGLNPDSRARLRYTTRANFPARLSGVRYADLKMDPKVREQCDGFIAACMANGGDLRSIGVGLLLWGKPGTGKTTVAAAAMREVLERADRVWLGKGIYDAKRPGYFTSHTAFIQKHHESWGQGEDAEDARLLLKSLYCRWTGDYAFRNTRLLVLDDAGKENPTVGTGHKSQVMHDVIRERYNYGAPTILTSNLRKHEWEANYGEATSSFLSEGFVSVKMDGEVFRRD